MTIIAFHPPINCLFDPRGPMGVSSKPSLAFGQTDPCIQPGGEISWKFVEKNATLFDQGPSPTSHDW